MTILKAVYENIDSSLIKKKIYLEIDDNRKYVISYVSLLVSKQYETLLDAISDNKFFDKKNSEISGALSIEYNSRQTRLNVYSGTLIGYYGIELDDKTGWLAVTAVSEDRYDLKISDRKISIFDDTLNFVRYVELTDFSHIFFMDKKFPVERISSVKKDDIDDCMICELDFNYEWIATYKYDIKSGEFMELMNICRL